jgi:hypothetical protein
MKVEVEGKGHNPSPFKQLTFTPGFLPLGL